MNILAPRTFIDLSLTLNPLGIGRVSLPYPYKPEGTLQQFKTKNIQSLVSYKNDRENLLLVSTRHTGTLFLIRRWYGIYFRMNCLVCPQIRENKFIEPAVQGFLVHQQGGENDLIKDRNTSSHQACVAPLHPAGWYTKDHWLRKVAGAQSCRVMLLPFTPRVHSCGTTASRRAPQWARMATKYSNFK